MRYFTPGKERISTWINDIAQAYKKLWIANRRIETLSQTKRLAHWNLLDWEKNCFG